MIRLSILAILLVLALFALIGTTTVYAQEQPGSDRFAALGFGMCEDRPCFLGIAPRLTGWTDALKIGRGQGGLAAQAGNAADIVFDRNRQHVTVARSLNSRRVYYVNVSLGALTYNLSAGEMAERYGMPCKVLFDSADSIAVLVYPYMAVTVTAPDSQMSPQSAVKEIDLSDPSLDAMPMYDLCVVYHDYANWAGFASAQYYTVNRLRAS